MSIYLAKFPATNLIAQPYNTHNTDTQPRLALEWVFKERSTEDFFTTFKIIGSCSIAVKKGLVVFFFYMEGGSLLGLFLRLSHSEDMLRIFL